MSDRKPLWVSFLLTLPFVLGCQVDYLLHSAYHQTRLMNARVPIDQVLEDEKAQDLTKRKLQLVREAKKFSEEKLGLTTTRNYDTFVSLDRPYVSYAVQVAKAFELKPHLWKFPFVGAVPYKGYFVKELAEKEAAQFPKDQYDTYVRGVTAFSTLGWFRDPVYSSMLRYEEEDLVETVIHETVHATLYIRSNADFNERLATFLGQEGVKRFYLEKEGPHSPTYKKIENDLHDHKIFSQFLSDELNQLKAWYAENGAAHDPKKKKARLKDIQNRFLQNVQPRFLSKSYKNFGTEELNNAVLLSYKTYLYDLSDFQKLLDSKNGDFREVIKFCKSLEKEKDPEKALKAL